MPALLPSGTNSLQVKKNSRSHPTKACNKIIRAQKQFEHERAVVKDGGTIAQVGNSVCPEALFSNQDGPRASTWVGDESSTTIRVPPTRAPSTNLRIYHHSIQNARSSSELHRRLLCLPGLLQTMYRIQREIGMSQAFRRARSGM